jgi:hypothetical protein
MSQAEQTAAFIEAKRAFYAWEPPGDEFKFFRCHHQPSHPFMREAQCRAAAEKPETFGERCGGRPRCPRWKYYRKLATAIVRIPQKRKEP